MRFEIFRPLIQLNKLEYEIMNIKYFGNSSFLFKSGNKKLAINPEKKVAKMHPDIIITSEGTIPEKTDAFAIHIPGEYEIKEIFVYGYCSEVNGKEVEHADLYLIDMDGINLGFIDRGVKTLKSNHLSELGSVDVLFIPLSREARMSNEKLRDVINRIEPYIIIPMDYDKDRLAAFISVMGIKEVENSSSLDIKSSDFQNEEMPLRCIVLEESKSN